MVRIYYYVSQKLNAHNAELWSIQERFSDKASQLAIVFVLIEIIQSPSQFIEKFLVCKTPTASTLPQC